jgi:hypothetical protein
MVVGKEDVKAQPWFIKGFVAAVFAPAMFKNDIPGSEMISQVQKLYPRYKNDFRGSKMITSPISGAEFAAVSIPGDHGGSSYGAKRVIESSQNCL